MELFTVNRYDDLAGKDDPEKEKKIMEKLQKSIKTRKRKQEIEEESKIQESIPLEDVKVDDENEINETPDECFKETEQKTLDETPAEVIAKPSSFMILGDEKFSKRKKIDMILPPWLAYPTVISGDLAFKREPIDNLTYLLPSLKLSLESMAIKQLFPVQEAVIPWILNAHGKPAPFRPRDICVSAPTGSGKTLAYALPIVQLLASRMERKIRALIVLPVNELAVQVLKVFKKLCEPIGLNCVLLSKFVPFEKEQSQLIEEFNGQLYPKVDIVVATSGRLVEHLHSTKGFSLKSLQFLVMDEADRIMEQIHNNWLYHLDNHVKENSDNFFSGRVMPLCYRDLCQDASKQPHKLLFSATLSQDPEKLQNLQLFQLKLFTSIVKSFDAAVPTDQSSEGIRGDFIGKYTTPEGLTEKYCMTHRELKPLTLYTLIRENKWNRFLCFANSGEAAHRLSYVLQYLLGDDMKIEELSSGLSPNVRKTVLQKFQTTKVDGLICSDALARGIDIKGVDIVISYDAPRHVKTYIHRIGRTARAGKTGLAVTLLTKQEMTAFNNIIKEGGKPSLEELMVNTSTEELKAKDYAKAVEHMSLALKKEQQQRVMRSVKEKIQPKIPSSEIGFIEQLQSQVQSTGETSELNVPESWKWQNQQQVNVRKERKPKKKSKNKFSKAKSELKS